MNCWEFECIELELELELKLKLKLELELVGSMACVW